jgi:hypothetical protein
MDTWDILHLVLPHISGNAGWCSKEVAISYDILDLRPHIRFNSDSSFWQ